MASDQITLTLGAVASIALTLGTAAGESGEASWKVSTIPRWENTRGWEDKAAEAQAAIEDASRKLTKAAQALSSLQKEVARRLTVVQQSLNAPFADFPSVLDPLYFLNAPAFANPNPYHWPQQPKEKDSGSSSQSALALAGVVAVAAPGPGEAVAAGILAAVAASAVVAGAITIHNAVEDSGDDPSTDDVGSGDLSGGSPRPHLKHPRSELPTGGERRYVPPKQKGNPEVVRSPGGKGSIDADGNEWEWARDQHGGPHFDVQHPDGTHTNVGPDGNVIGKDNFPNRPR